MEKQVIVFLSVFAWMVSMVNSLTDILSQVLGWLSIICVAGLAVVFSLLALLFRLSNEDSQHGAKILKFIP